MSDYDEQIEATYRVSEVETMDPQELQTLYWQALTELKDLRIEFDEFQCKERECDNYDVFIVVTSKEFESELEAALDDYRDRESEAKMDIERLIHEVKDFKRSSDKVERLEIDLAKLQDKYRLEVT